MDIQTIITLIVVPIIVALITSGVWSLIAQKKKTAAEVTTEEETAKKVAAETAELIRISSVELVKEYKMRIAELKQELENTKNEFTHRIEELECELRAAYVEIKRQDGVITGLNKKLIELSK